jgi:glutaredoxin
MNRYTPKECTNCGKVSKSDLLDVETNLPVCRPCHVKSFELYKEILRQREKEREKMADVVEPVRQLPTKMDLFIGHNESFAERMAMMEQVTDVWAANGVTWNDYLDS